MRNEPLVKIRLKRAKSNLKIAKAGKVFKDILYEDLCFDCEQAVEKALKAVLVSIDKQSSPKILLLLPMRQMAYRRQMRIFP